MLFMKKTLFSLSMIVVWLISSAAAQLAYPWKGHAEPYSFLFGNEFDTHQQSKAVGADQIQGFLYIHYTGETINGIPVAEHTNCDSLANNCRAGWKFQGSFTQGIYAGHNMQNHMPQFCVTADTTQNRSGISHFHWLGEPMTDMDLVEGQTYPGYVMQLVALDTFYFHHHDTLILVETGIDQVSHQNITTSCQ
jgi:hypothetical protein